MKCSRLRSRRLSLALGLTFGAAHAIAGGPGSCQQLQQVQIPNTTITSATYVSTPNGSGYCEVKATVAPQHDVQMRLPDVWKGRYLQWGGGGTDGYIPNMETSESSMLAGGNDPANNGFAVIASNGGHRGDSDFTFAGDRGLTLSYATAKIWDTDLVGRALLQKYYGKPAEHKYFAGCSNGGKNASVAAANFGDYYDGVIGGNGGWGHVDDGTASSMVAMAARWINTAQVGKISAPKAAALQKKMVEICDGLDGLKDGVISNVAACPLKKIVQSMACSSQNTDSCLTSAEISNVMSYGSPLVVNRNIVAAPYSLVTDMSTFGGTDAYAGAFAQMAKRVATPIDPRSINLNEFFPTMKTVFDDIYGMTGAGQGILRFLNKNKKLIMFADWEDAYVPFYNSIYFHEALKKADFVATQRNSRLYTNPGNMHCSYNGGGADTSGKGADASNLVYVMAKWVEDGLEPGSPGNPTISWRRPASWDGPQGLNSALFTRPMCTYPQYPAYSGRGDPTKASSFYCASGPNPTNN